ncbi:MAG TPA: ribosome-associated translation inhibitor RaiA [Candidatus Kapabacteria bacterium]|nr:ribosome-associated translation inhibitor RaiA [Candidatus Kapabacteria bacterium]
MKIQISNRHETAHPQIKSIIESELENLASRYDIIGADVILDHEGHAATTMSAEINVTVKGSTIIAKEKSDNVEKSVDLAFRSLEKQLKRHKETHYSSLNLKRNNFQR